MLGVHLVMVIVHNIHLTLTILGHGVVAVGDMVYILALAIVLGDITLSLIVRSVTVVIMILGDIIIMVAEVTEILMSIIITVMAQ